MKNNLRIIGILFFWCCLIASSSGQNRAKEKDKNIKTLYLVFDKLKSNDYNKDIIYADYFYHSPAGEADRVESEITYYKDTLFSNYHKILNTSIDYQILPLQKAKKQLGDSIVEYNYYYEGQKNNIYVLWTNTPERKYDLVDYFLMLDGKIVSLEGYTKDKGFIKWR
ncbi:MAG: hypothetical protein JWO09_3114 [Bacteroidetes bacterium]|nr:hypothetical protein [Bacteroidota bacterium]